MITLRASGLSQEARNKLLLFLSGFNLILLNYTLIRQITLAFRDLERSALIMALAYFAGISLGYAKSDALSTERLKTLLPLFLPFQMALVLLTPVTVLYLINISTVATAYFLIFLLVAAGSTSLYAVFLPALIQTEAGSTKRYYTAEIIGSLAGLLLLPFLAAFGMLSIFAAYFLSFLGITLLVQLRRSLVWILSLYILVFLVCFNVFDRDLAAVYYKKFYSGRGIDRVIFTRYSPYHKIEVIEEENHQRALLLNSHWQFGPASHQNYSYFAAEYPARLLNRPAVALLGCGSMSTVGRMGDYVQSIDIVDIDRAVFETSQAFFSHYNRLSELHNWTFHSDDAKHFLGTTQRKFDLIIDDIPPATTRQVALTYTREFFELVRSHLNSRGIYSLPSLTPIHSSRKYGRRVLATLAEVFDQVYVLTDGDSSYFFATDRQLEFERETLRTSIHHPRKGKVAILLPQEVKEFVRGEKTITINNMADLINY